MDIVFPAQNERLTNVLLDTTVRDGMDKADDEAMHKLLQDGGVVSGNLVHLKRDPGGFQLTAAPSTFGDTCCTKIRSNLISHALDVARPRGDGSDPETDQELNLMRDKADKAWSTTNAFLDFVTLQDDSGGLARRKVPPAHPTCTRVACETHPDTCTATGTSDGAPGAS